MDIVDFVKSSLHIGLDIGGTWIKVTAIRGDLIFDDLKKESQISLRKIKNILSFDSTTNDVLSLLEHAISLVLKKDESVASIGISIAGAVHGNAIFFIHSSRKILMDFKWISLLSNRFNAPIFMLNDADAAAIGAAHKGYLCEGGTIGIMPLGTGAGFCFWRDGRKWDPITLFPFRGLAQVPYINNQLYPGSHENDIRDINILISNPKYEDARKRLEYHYAHVIYSAALIYRTDLILLGGGIANAVLELNYDLVGAIESMLACFPSVSGISPRIEIMQEGNALNLWGAIIYASRNRLVSEMFSNPTETNKQYDISFNKLPLLPIDTLMNNYLKREKADTDQLSYDNSLKRVLNNIIPILEKGGKIILIADSNWEEIIISGTMILHRNGFSENRVYAFVPSDDSNESAVMDMSLADISNKDIIIGLNINNPAHYVNSGLALGYSMGAYTILIQEGIDDNFSYCNDIIKCGNDTASEMNPDYFAGFLSRNIITLISTIISHSAPTII